MNPEIRLLTASDAESYWRLRLEALELEPQSFAESAEEHRATTLESAVQRLTENPGDKFVLGAFLDENLIGMAGFYRHALAKARHKGRIWGVYVRQSFRGRGIGRALLTGLLEKIKTCQGVEQVSLTVITGQDAARSLYVSLGFTSYRIEPAALKVDGRYLDDEHMFLKI